MVSTMRPDDLKKTVATAPVSDAELEALYIALHERRTRFIGDVMKLRHQSPDTWLPHLRRAAVSFIRLCAANRRTMRILEGRSRRRP
ncbi:hypothetical protein Sp245p_26515 (plasmid) [Azospirillum baldaniorum]|uniref:Uncharacterized protein n=2 Tax=Azospirillum baldaniorum TaxID=1064539 RepID=A0A9P1K1X3_9PROT|nr:hypothetical protein Sp245p_26515 [Azospirillum baldaniorum]CCD04029.1 protein of unknown function [Azospirillum baldaniorum]